MNGEETNVLASFHDKITVVVSNPFAAVNECKSFLISLQESLLQLILSQLGL